MTESLTPGVYIEINETFVETREYQKEATLDFERTYNSSKITKEYTFYDDIKFYIKGTYTPNKYIFIRQGITTGQREYVIIIQPMSDEQIIELIKSEVHSGTE